MEPIDSYLLAIGTGKEIFNYKDKDQKLAIIYI